ncbi:MAG: hypothetical protein JXR97_08935 [Planctomycetes bacterium]|nr:hypothetical protein [Planctomycetota bacterium]
MAKVILWTQEDCPLCGKVKAAYAENGYEERNAQELIRGDNVDTDAMTQLAMQNMQLPIVMVDGEFVDPRAVISASGEAAA